MRVVFLFALLSVRYVRCIADAALAIFPLFTARLSTLFPRCTRCHTLHERAKLL
jgi:hypothetical protein